tara:strand:+ start:48 stop:272 length:225 start_codon:yes stop_codon:yes gene_type:complete
MTRKHYIAISRIIDERTMIDNDNNTNNNYVNKHGLVEDLCTYLGEDNDRFDRPRFIDACYKTNLVNGELTEGKE